MRASGNEIRLRRSVGRLLASVQMLRFLAQRGRHDDVAKIESCFSACGTYVRKQRKLDRILKDLWQEVFESAQAAGNV